MTSRSQQLSGGLAPQQHGKATQGEQIDPAWGKAQRTQQAPRNGSGGSVCSASFLPAAEDTALAAGGGLAFGKAFLFFFFFSYCFSVSG